MVAYRSLACFFMRKTKAEAIVAALLICNLFVSKSYASSQNSLVLRSITSATAKKEVVNFSDFDAISFFQENCHHCESQLRELACFKAKMSNKIFVFASIVTNK